MDSINAVIGDDPNAVVVGKDISTKYERTEGGQASVTITEGSGILQTLLFQLTRFESKLDNHITAVDSRFRGLEAPINSVDLRLRLIEKTIVELEHAGELRRRQGTELENQMAGQQKQLEDVKGQLDQVKVDVKSLHTKLEAAKKEEAQAVNRGITIPWFWVIVATIFITSALVLFVSLWARGG